MNRGIDKLNPPQQEAALHDNGPMLVLAGAGSGKTRVVTHRIARLLSKGIPAERIVAVTFTNRAAEEMRERIIQLAGNNACEGLFIGTFHSFGARILRKEIRRLDYPTQFSIFDYGDQLAALSQVMHGLGADTNKYDPKEVLNRISLAKAAFIKPGELKPSGDPAGRIAAQAYAPYQHKLKMMGAVDFEDLLFLPVCLLAEHQSILEKWKSGIDYILVDEYQDTNKIQFELVKRLSGQDGNLFVVGDDDQSIYAWRGADHTNILRFQEHFPAAQIVFLTQNYRSAAPILSAANAVIKHNTYRMDKELWTETTRGEPIRIVRCPAPEQEVEFVAQDIECRALEEGRPYSHFGILYRTNAQSGPMEDSLRALNIPCQTVGGTNFYDRKEIKDFVAYLRLIMNPRDEISLRRIINYPQRGLGDITVEALGSLAVERHIPLWDACREVAGGRTGAGTGADFQPRAVDALRTMVQIIEDATATMQKSGAHAAGNLLVERLRFIDAVMRGERSDKIATRKADNIKSLLHSLDWHTRNAQDPSLTAFVSRIALDTRSDKNSKDNGNDETGNAVTLMTLHSAKGLEFPIVYMLGLEEGYLPHRDRTGAALSPITDTDLAEERRLFYVGITRARVALTITLSRVRRFRGQNIACPPSRFLSELPEDELDDLPMEKAKQNWDRETIVELNKQKATGFFSQLNNLFG